MPGDVTPGPAPAAPAKIWLCAVPAAALAIAVYLPTLRWMYARFTAEDTYYSHGFLVPFVVGFLVWQRREAFREPDPRYRWTGFAMIVAALLAHLASMILYVFFTSGLSILLLLFGIALFLFGRTPTRELAVPLLFTAFMLPLPAAVIEKIAYPMKMNAASIGAAISSAVGIPVYKTGFYLETAGGRLLIDNPCSGLRSLIAFLAMGYLIACIARASVVRKAIVFLSAALIAVGTNVLRVLFLVAVASFKGVEQASAGAVLHDASGYAVFIVGGAALFAVARILECKS